MGMIADSVTDNGLRAQAEVAMRIMGDIGREVAILQDVGTRIAAPLELWCATELGVHHLSVEVVPADPEVGAVTTYAYTRWQDLGPVTTDITFANAEDVEPLVHVTIADLGIDMEARSGSDSAGVLAFARECAVRRGEAGR